MLTQPGHLQNLYKRDLAENERDEVRAEFIRNKLL
jgi:protein-arginine kinase